jgi:hypothetical protein
MRKEKGKAHPFASVLRATEYVLWMSTPMDTTTPREILRMVAALDIGMAIFILLMIGIRGYFRWYEIQTLPLIALGTLILCLPIACMITFFIVRSRRTIREAYAVTNERLLYRGEQGIRDIRLEAVTMVSVLPAEGTTGTLSFSPLFPMWPGVEEAAHIKQIIEDAKAQRISNP